MGAPYDAAANDAGPPSFNVSASTVPLALAKAIANGLRQDPHLELQAIGAGAIDRATRALTIARVLLANDGLDLGFIPMFGDRPVDGGTLIGMSFEVEYRPCTDVAPIISSQF